MKKFISVFAVIIMLFSFGVSADSIVNVNLDGKILFFDQYPVIIEGSTLVPMRKIFEELGATVLWDEKSKTATSTSDGTTVEIQIDSSVMRINDTEKTLNVPAQLINGRTLVPVRAVSEAFGCEVEWDGTNYVVIIKTDSYKKKEETLKRYISSDYRYSIAYSDKYDVKKGTQTGIDMCDFIISDLSSGSSLNVVVVKNSDNSSYNTQPNLKAELENVFGVTFDMFESEIYNYIPANCYSFRTDSAKITQIIYYTPSYIYTVTLCETSLITPETSSDMNYILYSLGV